MSADVAELILERFVERRELKAKQSQDGLTYSPDRCPSCWDAYRSGSKTACLHRPLDLAAMREHLSGRQTYGHYLINPETNTCRVFALDIDLTDEWQDGPNGPIVNPREIWADESNDRSYFVTQLNLVAKALSGRIEQLTEGEIRSAVAYSGSKGVHVYGFLPPGTPADEARGIGTDILESFGSFAPFKGKSFWAPRNAKHPLYEIEVYPKQDVVGGYGNLLRLPCGVHRKSHKQGRFLTFGDPSEFVRLDPIEALR